MSLLEKELCLILFDDYFRLILKFVCSIFQIVESVYEDGPDRFKLSQDFFRRVVNVSANNLGPLSPDADQINFIIQSVVIMPG